MPHVHLLHRLPSVIREIISPPLQCHRSLPQPFSPITNRSRWLCHRKRCHLERGGLFKTRPWQCQHSSPLSTSYHRLNPIPPLSRTTTINCQGGCHLTQGGPRQFPRMGRLRPPHHPLSHHSVPTIIHYRAAHNITPWARCHILQEVPPHSPHLRSQLAQLPCQEIPSIPSSRPFFNSSHKTAPPNQTSCGT